MAEISVDVLNVLKTEVLTNAVRKMVPVDKLATTEIFTGRRGTWQPTISWYEITFPQTILPFSGRSAPAWNMDMLKRVKRYEEPATIYVRKAIDAETLSRLHTLNSEDVNAATEIIRDEIIDMKMQYDSTLEYLCWLMLTGTVAIDQTTAAYAADVSKIKIDITVPLTKTTMTQNLEKDAEFLSVGLQELRDADYQGFGELKGDCYCNGATMSHMYASVEMKAYMSDRKKDEFWMRGENAIQIGDFTFKQFDRGYKTAGGTYTQFIAEDYFVRIPKSPQWRAQNLYIHELSMKVPDQGGSKNLIDMSPGIVFYADVETNPPAYVLYLRSHFLPIIKWPTGLDYTTCTDQ